MNALRRFPLYFICSLGLLAATTSCDQDHRQDPTPVTPAASNSFVGKASVIDQNGRALSAEGIEVSVLNAPTPVSVRTNANGEYTLPGLPAGSYQLGFSRAGLSTLYISNVRLDTDRTTRSLAPCTLVAEPEERVTALSAQTASGEVALSLTIATPQPTEMMGFAVFFGTSPSLTRATAGAVGSNWGCGSNVLLTQRSTDVRVSRAELLRLGLNAPSGTRVYAVGYGCGVWHGQYLDPSSNQLIQTPSAGNTPSPVVSFIMP